jgi:hypothetical protein
MYTNDSLVPVVSHLRISLMGLVPSAEIKTERQRVSRDLAVRRVVLPGCTNVLVVWPHPENRVVLHMLKGAKGILIPKTICLPNVTRMLDSIFLS